MASCSRCSVAFMMNRNKHENVLQVIGSAIGKGDGWIPYEIYIKCGDRRKFEIDRGDKVIRYDGSLWKWGMTLFSMHHSKDEDCSAVGKHKIHKLTDGFPTSVDITDVEVIHGDWDFV